MVRPKAKELTERELEVMHVFWDQNDDLAISDVREKLDGDGRELAYTTVATLVKILVEKEFLIQTNEKRPFTFKPTRTFEDVSGNIVSDLVSRVFSGSREQLLIQLMGKKKLTKREREFLENILKEKK
jgi:predicted transcriptional regulator